MRVTASPRALRSFNGRHRRIIEIQIARGLEPCCPRCGEVLEAQPTSRLLAVIPAHATGFDLDCRGCRQFYSRIQHTAESIRLHRLQRLAKAVLRA